MEKDKGKLVEGSYFNAEECEEAKTIVTERYQGWSFTEKVKLLINNPHSIAPRRENLIILYFFVNRLKEKLPSSSEKVFEETRQILNNWYLFYSSKTYLETQYGTYKEQLLCYRDKLLLRELIPTVERMIEARKTFISSLNHIGFSGKFSAFQYSEISKIVLQFLDHSSGKMTGRLGDYFTFRPQGSLLKEKDDNPSPDETPPPPSEPYPDFLSESETPSFRSSFERRRKRAKPSPRSNTSSNERE
ncbi:hypothetical protein ACFL0U_01250 [Pseudomonadota bacterium]